MTKTRGRFFSSQEIRGFARSPSGWHRSVRREEIEFLLDTLDLHPTAVLELGAGDGTQSGSLAKRAGRLVCTDLDLGGFAQDLRKYENIELLTCDATDLSEFRDGEFDMVYSSNVLEHVKDVELCVSEIFRVLAPGGVCIHTVPTVWWKLANWLGYLAAGTIRVPVHTPEVGRSHWREFQEFRQSFWCSTIKKSGLEVRELIPLPFYFGHGGRFQALTALGNALRLPGTIAYVAHRPTSAVYSSSRNFGRGRRG